MLLKFRDSLIKYSESKTARKKKKEKTKQNKIEIELFHHII